MRLVSVVIPVYDSPVLEELAIGIERAFAGSSDDYEIIFVDDGSPDPRVWPMLERLARERAGVRVLQLTRSFGQQAATLCGLVEARGELVVTMDDDLQHDPADIPQLLAHGGHDIVIAQFERKKHHFLRRAVSRVKGAFDHLLIGKPKHLQLTSFRVLGRAVVDGVLAIRTPHPFLPALMFHISKDVVGAPVSHSRRAGGRSGYTLRKLFAVFTNLIINNSSILLRVAAIAGMGFAGLSFLVAGLAIYRKLVRGITVEGWASLFSAVLLMGGLLLLSIGIVGEYLLRIIESSEARPTYFVRRRSGDLKTPESRQ
jgi:dolichol-phosphate mannosyltransferase/undecaprenyl-phosphate 4-deoxy-4-formamido-L-arabinose transferase